MASDFTLKTAEQMRDDMLRTERAGLIAIGVSNPNVTPGSDAFVRAQSVGDQLEIAMANTQVKADAQMIDTATGEDLDRLLGIYGLARRGAGGSSGNGALSSTASTSIVVGSRLIDGAGLRFEVAVGGTYANTETVPLTAIDTGDGTNHAAGDTLRWVNPPPFSAPTMLVSTGGLTGGVNAEDDETARQRLYSRIRTPPSSGNWSHIAEVVEESTPVVQKGFVYPAVNGPGNVGVAVVGYATDVSKSRVISSVVVTNTVKAYLDGTYPEHVDTIVTGVTDTDFDMSVELTLPASPKASPAGPGGGWTDGTSWPRNTAGSATFRCTVTAVTSTTQFTVDAPTSPTANVTQIAWLSPEDWTVYTATVTAVSGSTGAYVITLDKPFTGVAVGHYISPNAVNITAYFEAILAHFALMGPGEKVSTSAASYARAYRRPIPAQSWPMKVDATMLRALTDAGDEVLDAAFLYRTSTAAPTVPATVADAPAIFVPNNIGLYEKLS